MDSEAIDMNFHLLYHQKNATILVQKLFVKQTQQSLNPDAEKPQFQLGIKNLELGIVVSAPQIELNLHCVMILTQ